jgi:hypothetical protein
MTSAAELVAEVMDDLERKRSLFTYDAGSGLLYLNACRQPYEVPVRDIITRDDLFHWTEQLSAKNWMTLEILRMFIQHVYEIKGWTHYSSR